MKFNKMQNKKKSKRSCFSAKIGHTQYLGLTTTITQQFTLMKSGERNPANIYLLKVNNRNTRKRCETSSKLILKTPERRQ